MNSDRKDPKAASLRKRIGSTRSTLRLWDGKMYDVGSLDCLCDELVDYAAIHPSLNETMPDVSRRIGLVWARFTALVFPIACLPQILCAAGWAISKGDLCGFVVVSFFLVILPWAFFVPVVYLCAMLYARRMRPTVVAQDGQLEVAWGGDREIAKLPDCSWFLGRIADMQLFKLKRELYRLPDTVIIIQLPGRMEPHLPLKVPVGFSPEMRRIWESFLTLAGVPEANQGKMGITH